MFRHMALTAKTLIISTFILTVILAVVGLYIYYSYSGPIHVLANGVQPFGQVMDRVKYMEYNVTEGNETFIIKVSNSPETRSGQIDVYKAGNLVYTLEYSYDDNGLKSASIVYPNGTISDLDTVAYDESFKTSLELTLAGEASKLTHKPGVGPVYAIFFLTDSIGINWKSLVDPKATEPPSTFVRVDAVPADINTTWGVMRGTVITMVPEQQTGILPPPSPWALVTFQFNIVDYNGLLVASSYTAVLVTQQDEYRVTVNLVDLETVE